MPNQQTRNRSAPVDPEPNFASPGDIELAEELLHRLEERYFGGPARAAVTQAPQPKVH
jgi:hypothetical protein